MNKPMWEDKVEKNNEQEYKNRYSVKFNYLYESFFW